jgi:hypothetical protein
MRVCVEGKREQGEGEVNKGLDLWRGTCLGDVELLHCWRGHLIPARASATVARAFVRFNRAIMCL